MGITRMIIKQTEDGEVQVTTLKSGIKVEALTKPNTAFITNRANNQPPPLEKPINDIKLKDILISKGIITDKKEIE